jgi:biotin carboxyl carrier protein
VERARILEQHNENTDAFLAQYEQKEHERLLLFDNIADRDVRQLYRPVRGVVVQEADPAAHQYITAVRTAKNENVLATLRGTVVAVTRTADNTYSLTLQNSAFVAVYSNIARVLKTEGTQVEKGETIGLMDGEHDLGIQLWDAGRFVNPNEVIVW